MAQISLMGREFDVAPYKIKQLRTAAPLIEKINATLGSLLTITGGIEVASDLIAFAAIGLSKIQADLVPENLEDQLGFDDIPDLQKAFVDILRASGFKSGEAPAPAAKVAAEGASTISSDVSASASPPQV